MATPINILIVEDSERDAELAVEELRRAGFDPKWKRVDTEADFLSELENSPEIILSDYTMPQFTGLRAAQLLQESRREIPFILISGTVGEEVAVEAMRFGATDYLLKDRIARLGAAVNRALEQKRFREENEQTRRELLWKTSLLDAMLDNIPSYIYFKDLQSRFVRVSRSLANLFKISDPEKIKGKTDFDFFPQNHAQASFEDEQRIIRTGQPLVDKQELVIYPNGQKYWGLVSKLPWRDKTGTIIGTLGITRDITAIREADEKLDRERLLLRTLIDLLPDIFYVKDLESRFLMANEAMAKSFGKNHYSEILGLSDADFFPPGMASAMRAQEQKVFAGESVIDHEDEVVLPNGRKYTLLTTKVPFCDNQGRICGLVGIGRDFTDRKRAEETISYERGLLRTLIDLLPETFYVKDLDSRFLMANEELAKRFCRKSYSEVLGLSDADFFPPKVAEAYRANEKKVLAGEPLIDHEGKIRFPDGREFTTLTTKMPFRDSQGRICGLVGIGRDITERKRSEETIANERQLLRTLIDLLPDIFYVKDMESRFLMANEALAKSFGKNHYSKIIGLSDADFFPPEMAAVFRAEEKKVLSGEPLIDHEENVVFPDGRKHTLLTTKVPFRDSQGRICGLVGIGRDFTERKRSEETIANERQLLRTLIDLLPETFHVKDNESRFLMVNEALAKRFCKKSYSEVLGLSDADFFPPEVAASYREEEKKVLAGEVLVDHESMVRFPDGREYMLMTSKVPFRDVQGRICGLVGIGRDITERKRAEMALAAEQKLLNNLMTATLDLIYFKDRECRFVRINDAFARRLGLADHREVLGKTDFDIFADQHAREAYEDEQRILSTGEPIINKEEYEKWKDGHVTWVSSTKLPLRDSTGQITGIVGISRDITKQKQLEEQFRQAQKMEAAGQLAGGVAHDFNNILAVIQIQTELLKDTCNLSPTEIDIAEEISAAAQRATALTRQLLMFSRKENISLRDVDLSQSINDLTKLLRRTIGADVQIEYKFAMESMFVHADAGMVDQVLMNLAVNARDAMPKGGKFIIETSAVEFDQQTAAQSAQIRPGSFVCLSVSDTGCGIPPENLPRIFEPFFTTKEVGKGTGLGLATVFGIVKQHQGWINVYSEVGRGTTFRIYLPRVAKAAGPKSDSHTDLIFRGKNETILLVEDDAFLRGSVNKTLKHLGYRVLVATNGVEALEVWKKHRDEIDLLLTDLVMPGGLTGLDVGGQLLQEKPTLKVIYSSGYSADVASKSSPLQEGINFLNKPYQTGKLSKTLRAALDG